VLDLIKFFSFIAFFLYFLDVTVNEDESTSH